MVLSVVIPVYNSQETLEPLVEKLQDCLSAISFEVVLVNDGSRDNSEAVVYRLAERYTNVQGLSLRRNFGEFNAVLCGLTYARGDYAVLIDDDFQNPPEAILTLLERAQSGHYDVVYSRYAQKKHAWFRNAGSSLLNYLTTYLLDKPKSLYLSSFKLINRAVVQEIVSYTGPFPYIDALIFRVTRNVTSVEVPHHPRQSGASNYTLSKLVALFLNVLFGFSTVPLRLFAGLGLGLFGLSLLLGLGLLLGSSLHWFSVSGWVLVAWVVLLLAGLQMVFLAVMSEYLGKLFLAQSGLKPFVVKERG
ncbi:glycosyltransferase family 2 protein [Rudanella lutea]|uniref:glycosyltransferase family 2 protein n=1 Tax=Rudanella lutea TaxID=451374 RepID=UPI00036E8994|nr:glycosyltransferase family 2 protein [Rudanella lutea]